MSDPTALVAELRAGKVGPLPDGWDMGHYEEAVQRLLDRAAALIAQQAATIAARDDELIGERWHADEAARQRDVAKAALTAAEAERDRLREAGDKAYAAMRSAIALCQVEVAALADEPRERAVLRLAVFSALELPALHLGCALQPARAALSTAKESGRMIEVGKDQFYRAISGPENIHPHSERDHSRWEIVGTRVVVGRSEPGYVGSGFPGRVQRYWLTDDFASKKGIRP